MGYENKWSITIDTQTSKADGRMPLPYQQDAIDHLNAYFDLSGKAEEMQSGMLIMPTGSGKTFTAVTWLLTQGVARGYRIVWLVHRQELVRQTLRAFCKRVPILAADGIPRVTLMAVSGSREHGSMSMAVGNDITVASIRSVATPNGRRYIHRMLGKPGKEKLIVVIDEAHHATTQGYREVLRRMRRLSPHLILLGLTATPKRMQDNNRLLRMFHLAKGEKAYRGPVYQTSLDALIKDEILSIPHYQKISTGIQGEKAYRLKDEDIAYMKKYHEFSRHVLDAIATHAARNQLIVKEYRDHRETYGKTLVFAVNKQHAKELCTEFRLAGISSEYIVSGKAENTETIAKFRQGAFPVLVNVQMMIEGVDVPDIQTVFLTRETNSPVYFMQMVGRGLRGERAGGTRECYIVDFYDQWEKLKFWVHPEEDDIFALGEEEEGEGEPEPAPKTGTQGTPEWLPAALELSYRSISAAIRSTLTVTERSAIWPVGWYHLGSGEGMRRYIVVWSNQETAFAECTAFLEKRCAEGYMKEEDIRKTCRSFLQGVAKPNGIALLAAYVAEHQAVPPYYNLETEDAASPQSAAARLSEQFELVTHKLSDEQIGWLRVQYESSERMKAIYSTFPTFQCAVEDLLMRQKRAELVEREERKEYHIEPDVYDLKKLLEHVYKRFPQLRRAQLYGVHWSHGVVKSWFGRCTALDGDQFLIEINLLLSSRGVPQEVIEYLLYHELLHANGNWAHTPEFREAEWRFPDSARWDSFLDRMQEEYKLDYKALRKEAKKWKAGYVHFLKKAKGEMYASTVIAEEEQAKKEWKEKGGILVKPKETNAASMSGEKPAAKPSFPFATGLLERGYNPHFYAGAPGVKAGTKYCCWCGKPMPSVLTICPHCDKAVPVRRNAK